MPNLSLRSSPVVSPRSLRRGPVAPAVALAVTLIACGKGAPSGQGGAPGAQAASCAAASQTWRTRLEVQATSAALDQGAREIAAQCTQGRWSAAATTCFTTATDAAAIGACIAGLPPAQRSALTSTKVPMPITEADAAAFGDAFVAALRSCGDRPAALTDLFDLPEANALVRGRMPPGATEVEIFTDELGAILCGGIDPHPKFALRGTRVVDGAPRPRVRIIGTGVNFLEPVLRRRDDGSVAAIDVYSFLIGGVLSSQAIEGAKLEARPDVETVGPIYLEADDLNAAGKPAEAYARYQALPEDMRRGNGAVAALGLAIAAKLDDATYAAEIAAFTKAFPDDSRVLLASADTYAIRKDYPKLAETLTQMIKRIGDDPALLSMRAQAYRRAGDYPHAKADAVAALAAEPKLEEAARATYDVAVAMGDFAEAVHGLHALEGSGLSRDVLEAHVRKDPPAKKLVASPEFKLWVAER